MLSKVNDGIAYVKDMLVSKRILNEQEKTPKIYKYAIIIPIHEQKANWLIGFLNSYLLHNSSSKDFEIILAVSNEHEFNVFNRMLTQLYSNVPFFLFNVEKYINSEIGISNLIERYRNNTDGCIVNLKKFLAMHWAVKQSYEYILVKDCDSYFYRETDIGLFNQAIKNYNKYIYLGGNIINGLGGDGFSKILRTCAQNFKENDFEKIRHHTKDFSVYPWFFEIPFYKVSDLRNFFNLMVENATDLGSWLETMSWHHFEHLIFIFYRIIYFNARLIDYSEDGISGPPEDLALVDILMLYRKYDYCPLWVSATKTLHQVEVLEKLDNTSLLYHMDRF